MPSLTLFLVERYLPGLTPTQVEELGRRLREAARELRGEGRNVEWLRSIGLIEDETCLCSFRAASAADVGEANDRAGAGYERILEVTHAENSRPAVL